jgi:hypothetical protein
MDTPGSTGDYERRSSFPDLCANPTEIQARFTDNSGIRRVANGPRDRLTFDLNGLVCVNAEQPDGQSCHDYTLRYICQ